LPLNKTFIVLQLLQHFLLQNDFGRELPDARTDLGWWTFSMVKGLSPKCQLASQTYIEIGSDFELTRNRVVARWWFANGMACGRIGRYLDQTASVIGANRLLFIELTRRDGDESRQWDWMEQL
jgi:hypothetical protein